MNNNIDQNISSDFSDKTVNQCGEEFFVPSTNQSEKIKGIQQFWLKINDSIDGNEEEKNIRELSNYLRENDIALSYIVKDKNGIDWEMNGGWKYDNIVAYCFSFYFENEEYHTSRLYPKNKSNIWIFMQE